MKLLLFSVGENPSSREHKDAYGFLTENAPRNGYDEIDVLAGTSAASSDLLWMTVPQIA